ncbi:MAG: TonB-dependent receptor plug domain-containing protein, partial [Desulfobacteraceae bacterium]
MWLKKNSSFSDSINLWKASIKSPSAYLLSRFAFIAVVVLVFNISAHQCLAQPDNDNDSLEYLKNLSIEELLQTEVTSVSKRSEQLFDAAAAVFVITQEDIKRSGARSIPEALRMVPGLQVAHINGSTFAITARGFNEWFSNKLLVLIDGRSVYTPLFSGVYWDIQDTVIEDIKRIEVIRGPGATLWGANAVNGVINIITKHSENTQGGLVVGGIGNIENPLVVARYGGKAGENATYRIYAKGVNRDSFNSVDGGDANDQWENRRVGFRTDLKISPQDFLTFQGENFYGADDFTLRFSGYVTPPYSRETEEEQT